MYTGRPRFRYVCSVRVRTYYYNKYPVPGEQLQGDLGGTPEVTEQGNIVYVFDVLQVRAAPANEPVGREAGGE